jgi:DNA-binding transcriptional MerR regulator
MASGYRETTVISITVAVRRTGLSDRQVRTCIERGLVVEPLSAGDLRELRRIRRLRELGVNWAGIEIILNMRRRMRAMQAERIRRQYAGRWVGWSAPDGLWHRRLPWKPDGD